MKKFTKEEIKRQMGSKESQEKRLRYALADKNRSLAKNWAR